MNEEIYFSPVARERTLQAILDKEGLRVGDISGIRRELTEPSITKLIEWKEPGKEPSDWSKFMIAAEEIAGRKLHLLEKYTKDITEASLYFGYTFDSKE